MSQESDRDILMDTRATVRELKENLIGEDGRIPKLEDARDEHAKQINFWRGAIALIGLLVLALSGAVLAHVMEQKSESATPAQHDAR